MDHLFTELVGCLDAFIFLTSRKLNIFFQLVDIFLAINFFTVLFMCRQFYKPDLIVFLVILDHLI